MSYFFTPFMTHYYDSIYFREYSLGHGARMGFGTYIYFETNWVWNHVKYFFWKHLHHRQSNSNTRYPSFMCLFWKRYHFFPGRILYQPSDKNTVNKTLILINIILPLSEMYFNHRWQYPFVSGTLQEIPYPFGQSKLLLGPSQI